MTDALWSQHDAAWRDPVAVASGWSGAQVDARLLRSRTRGDWWGLLDQAGLSILVTREYEHLVLALAVEDGHPSVTYLPLPHPSGLVIDTERQRAVVASTRNPNQLFELGPVRDAGDDRQVLIPLASRTYPGSLYLHDLALIGGELHGNAVGRNTIVSLRGDGAWETVWWPRCVERDGEPDTSRNYIQLNSIAAGRDVASSFFTASSNSISGRRPGYRNYPVDRRGVVFSGGTGDVVARGLTRPHSARLDRGELWLDNSGYGEVGRVTSSGFEPVARLEGWTRGLCLHGELAIVGTSRVIPRYSQYAPGLDVEKSVCGLHALDRRSGAVLASLVWPYGNQVFAVEAVGPERRWELPLTAGSRSPKRVRRLFYDFRPPDNGERPR